MSKVGTLIDILSSGKTFHREQLMSRLNVNDIQYFERLLGCARKEIAILTLGAKTPNISYVMLKGK
jgi:hypothetical protein